MATETLPVINWNTVQEKRRIYTFPGNQQLMLENVTKVEVRPSGKHRVETAEGRKVFVNTGWLWLEIETDEGWSF